MTEDFEVKYKTKNNIYKISGEMRFVWINDYYIGADGRGDGAWDLQDISIKKIITSKNIDIPVKRTRHIRWLYDYVESEIDKIYI